MRYSDAAAQASVASLSARGLIDHSGLDVIHKIRRGSSLYRLHYFVDSDPRDVGCGSGVLVEASLQPEAKATANSVRHCFVLLKQRHREGYNATASGLPYHLVLRDQNERGHILIVSHWTSSGSCRRD